MKRDVSAQQQWYWTEGTHNKLCLTNRRQTYCYLRLIHLEDITKINSSSEIAFFLLALHWNFQEISHILVFRTCSGPWDDFAPPLLGGWCNIGNDRINFFYAGPDRTGFE
jgi:hypothetical protein